MRATHVGAVLIGLGLLVGALAGLGLLLGLAPSHLPAALLDLAAYKLTFLAAFGLLAAGAVVQRYARRATGRPPVARRAEETPQLPARHAAGEPPAGDIARRDPEVRAPNVERRS